jgi:arylsulfatase A-like enzyme
MICLNAPDCPESKLTMKSTRFNCLCHAWLLPALLLEFSATAQSLVFSNAAPAAIPRRASIILVVADGLGCGDLSCYGQTNFQTPNLDKLAAEGIRFTNYYAGDAAESPARAALMLGKDSGHLRQRADADISLSPDEITVAQVLRQSGYHTGLIGEWNLGDENSSGAPWKKGFDEFAGFLDANDAENFYADYIWSLPPNFSYDKASGKFIEWSPPQGAPAAGREMIYRNTQGKNQFIPDLLTKAAMNFIQHSLPDQFNRYRPFFLLLNYKIPGDGRSQVPTDAPFSEEPWPQPAKNKAAMIARLDGYIGQLTEQLQKLGMTNNAAIFFTSGTVPKITDAVAPVFFHSLTSTNDARVPMIARWPGTIPAGAVSNFKWSAPDFLPTAAEIAFTKPPAGATGSSVLPTLREPTGK